MDIRTLTGELSVAPQILALDLKALADAGFKSVICNRPDGEAADQPNFDEIERAASQHGLHSRYLPAESGKVSDEQGAAFGTLMAELPKPVLAYCRTGMRSTTMWALSQAGQSPQNVPLPQIIERSSQAGFDLKGVVRRIVNGGKTPVEVADATHEVVIIGGGAAGISVASSLLARSPGLDIAIIDPADIHYYQPGWTLVGDFELSGFAAGAAVVDEAALSGTARQVLNALRTHGASFFADLQHDTRLLGTQAEQALAELVAHGLVTDRSGAVRRRFTVKMVGRWQGDEGVLEEDFRYSDGATERRVWRLTRGADGRYSGRADDVVGTAIGQAAGNALNWRYTLRLPVDGSVYEVQFDDWMYLMDERVMLNKATMSKFGIRLGEVTLSFTKN